MKIFRKISDHEVNLAIRKTIEASYERRNGIDNIEVEINLDPKGIGPRIREIREATGDQSFSAASVAIHHNALSGYVSERKLWNLAHTFGDLIKEIWVHTQTKEEKVSAYYNAEIEMYCKTKAVHKFEKIFDRKEIRAKQRAKEKYLDRCARAKARMAA